MQKQHHKIIMWESSYIKSLYLFISLTIIITSKIMKLWNERFFTWISLSEFLPTVYLYSLLGYSFSLNLNKYDYTKNNKVLQKFHFFFIIRKKRYFFSNYVIFKIRNKTRVCPSDLMETKFFPLNASYLLLSIIPQFIFHLVRSVII